MNDRLKDHRVAVRLTDQETEDDRLGSTPAPSSERYLSETDGALRAIAIASLLGAALIHLLNLPGTMREVPYVGWLSIAPIAGSIFVAACSSAVRLRLRGLWRGRSAQPR